MIQTKKPLPLALALGLRPLDRVQISSTHEIAESRAFARYNDVNQELPFFYFQRVIGDQIEVRSPGGYAALISPHDICDVIPGTTIEVQAMPSEILIQRQQLSVLARNSGPGPECFAPAHVLHASRTSRGLFEFYVWFLDPALNEKNPWMAPLPTAERRRIEAVARRTHMPVSSRASASHSADHGREHARAHAARVASLFINAARSGRSEHASQLASVDVRQVSLASLNRRFGALPPPCQVERPSMPG
ncbi:hypothetical protein [Rhodoferax ferrireducens]|nr:hypothetical protein [Rhodoferax ferrireducens]